MEICIFFKWRRKEEVKIGEKRDKDLKIGKENATGVQKKKNQSKGTQKSTKDYVHKTSWNKDVTLHIEKTLGKWAQNNQHQHILVKLLGFEKRNNFGSPDKKNKWFKGQKTRLPSLHLKAMLYTRRKCRNTWKREKCATGIFYLTFI